MNIRGFLLNLAGIKVLSVPKMNDGETKMELFKQCSRCNNYTKELFSLGDTFGLNHEEYCKYCHQSFLNWLGDKQEEKKE